MKPTSSTRAIVFDLDGTLFHLPVDWKEVRKDLDALMGRSLDGAPIFDAIAGTTEPGSQARKDLFAVIDRRELPASDSARPIDGAVDLVAFAAARFRIGLVTMQGRLACRRVLLESGQLSRFEVILTREDSLSRKEQILMALRAMSVPPADSLFVGDKRSDLDSGRAIGVEVALVGAGAREEWHPDILCRRLGELQATLQARVGIRR